MLPMTFPLLPAAARTRCALRTLVLLAALCAVGAAGVSHADTDADRARAALRSGEILPLSRILDAVSRQYAGDVIDVKLDRDDGICASDHYGIYADVQTDV